MGVGQESPQYAVLHIMSQMIAGYHDYNDQDQYKLETSLGKDEILVDGKALPQRGMGNILAVA